MTHTHTHADNNHLLTGESGKRGARGEQIEQIIEAANKLRR